MILYYEIIFNSLKINKDIHKLRKTDDRKVLHIVKSLFIKIKNGDASQCEELGVVSLISHKLKILRRFLQKCIKSLCTVPSLKQTKSKTKNSVMHACPLSEELIILKEEESVGLLYRFREGNRERSTRSWF